ncbi:MAG: hypothetical protein EOP49_02850 [Sphingobacteriales bacterium]|nr:MAG: hypothetical protein EOP49_02850 [Sphingobacteriales bacterium]
MKYMLLVTVLFYKTETKKISPDYFGFATQQVSCDTGRVVLKGKYLKTDSTIVVRKGNTMKTFYWYEMKK